MKLCIRCGWWHLPLHACCSTHGQPNCAGPRVVKNGRHKAIVRCGCSEFVEPQP